MFLVRYTTKIAAAASWISSVFDKLDLRVTYGRLNPESSFVNTDKAGMSKPTLKVSKTVPTRMRRKIPIKALRSLRVRTSQRRRCVDRCF
jgi:hypothetical protein